MRKSFILTAILATTAFALLAIEVSIWIASGSTAFEYAATLSYFFLFFCGAIAGLISGYTISLKNSFGKALYFLGIAQMFSMAAIVWFDYAHMREWTTYPSLGDFLYILAAPCAAIGLAFIFRLHHMKFTKRSLLGIIICIAAAAAITLAFLGFPHITEMHSMAGLFDLFYIIADALQLSIILIILYAAKGKTYHGLHLYMAGIAAHFIANALFAFRTETSLYAGLADPAEIMLIISAALYAIGIAAMYRDFQNRIEAAHK